MARQPRRGLLLVAICLMATGACRSSNERRATDDLQVTIDLRRSFARDLGRLPHPCRDLDLTIDEPEEFVVAAVVLGIAAGTRRSVDQIPPTHVTIYPDDDPAYQQRLYWGRNEVFFPAACRDHDLGWLFRVVISGDRNGCDLYVIPPPRHDVPDEVVYLD